MDKLTKLIEEIKTRHEAAANWRFTGNNEIERIIAVNNNAGREEALYALLNWIDTNIEE